MIQNQPAARLEAAIRAADDELARRTAYAQTRGWKFTDEDLDAHPAAVNYVSLLGLTNWPEGTVMIDKWLLACEYRHTLAHELKHLERGPNPVVPHKVV